MSQEHRRNRIRRDLESLLQDVEFLAHDIAASEFRKTYYQDEVTSDALRTWLGWTNEHFRRLAEILGMVEEMGPWDSEPDVSAGQMGEFNE